MTIEALQAAAVSFADEREWNAFHDPKNLAMALAAEVGELNALFRWVPSHESDEAICTPERRQLAEQEIADIAILVLLFCARAKMNLEDAIIRKLEVNARNYPQPLSRGRPDRPL